MSHTRNAEVSRMFNKQTCTLSMSIGP